MKYSSKRKSSPKLEALARFAKDQSVKLVHRVRRAELDRLSHGVVHQGVAAHAPPLEVVPLATLADEPALLGIALEFDPGPSELRSRSPLRGSARGAASDLGRPRFGTTHALDVSRASAGAIEHARLCRVPSLNEAVAALRDNAVQVVGLDATAPKRLADLDLTLPTVLVLGGEGEGLGRAVRRSCSTLAALGGMASVDSLNASVAAGIALYEMSRQRAKSNG